MPKFFCLQHGVSHLLLFRAALALSLFFSFNCSKTVPQFDAQRAFGYLQNQCDFGPRNPGSEAHQKTKQYLFDSLNKLTNLVSTQEFIHFDSALKKELILTNIVATFYPEEKERILLCAHWDTRPWADQDPQVENITQPILGANDGASGVAVLLELAHILSQKKPKFGVDIVFFDGEDYGRQRDLKNFCLGSSFFAKNLPIAGPKFGILLDMVGDKDLNIYKEQYSYTYAPEIVDLIWSKAKKLELNSFHDQVRHSVWDDHMPLILAGIPTVDIIDFDYPYWHTLQDTPDKCSEQSLETVGKLLISILYD
ncbi:MAG: Peptidase M28 [candidate division Zixibacteria bacterium RBG-1]|nr:MAG: Peptidase M28 [candidate division Zixibacteria bacterium RBG-1]OGC84757.1 MAG: hypothetical protein A2V73_05545 [candidate division Zixibacteria bacterium RBG_19FT_COMBO_42_43]